MTPTNIPYPLFFTKPWQCIALHAPLAGCSLKQVCSLSPNGAAHLQQSCKKDASKVAASLDESEDIFYCCVADSDVEEEYGKLEGDGDVSPSSSLFRCNRRLGKDTRAQMAMSRKSERQH